MTEFAVFGAGFVGVCTAISLKQRGFDVLLVDNAGIGAGASFGNAGIIQSEAVAPYAMPREISVLIRVLLGRDARVRVRFPDVLRSGRSLFSYFIESSAIRHRKATMAYAQLIQHARNDHSILADTAGARELLFEGGYRVLFRNPSDFEDTLSTFEALAKEFKLPLRRLTAHDLGQLEPGISETGVGAIEWSDPLRTEEPHQLLQRYFDYFTAMGGRFKIGDARSLAPARCGWSFVADDRPHDAAQAVIATGAGTVEIAARLGARLPMVTKRGYHAVLKGGRKLNLPLIDADVGVVLLPQGDLLRVTTGAELGGRTADPNSPQLERAIRLGQGLLGAEVEPISTWSGVRPCMPDMLPVIGRSTRHKGLWYNFGHGHQGLTLAPTSGRILADAIFSREPIPGAFDPSRYSL